MVNKEDKEDKEEGDIGEEKKEEDKEELSDGVKEPVEVNDRDKKENKDSFLL